MKQNMMTIIPPVFAHRGASYYAPENTNAAFLKAKELGVRWLEFDVMLTADQQVVVIHDETVDRTTNGIGYVSDMTYDELSRLDAGSWFGKAFSGEKIPLLKDVLVLLNQKKLFANIEIKAIPGQERKVVEQVLALIKSTWTQEKNGLLFSSFSWEILNELRKLDASVNIGLLMHEWLSDWKRWAEKLNCISVHINHEILQPSKIALITQTQRPVYAYTVNDTVRAKELFSWGVNAVYSDCPDRILKELK